jgi:MerR family transcriptional regulator, redox-sensitive transcriptional activator SoxR
MNPLPATSTTLTIGELSRRSGVAASALRFYEDEALVTSLRGPGGQRRYARDALRRVAFIRAAQTIGLRLDEIRESLASLPSMRTPNKVDWARLSKRWRPLLDERIKALTTLRDQLDACIGCGCLSLTACKLYNPADAAGSRGNGARYLLGDARPDPSKTP